MPPITVLVGDSQRLFAEALTSALADNRDLEIISEHPGAGFEAIELARVRRPDVALLEWFWIDGMEGLAVTRAIAQQAPEVKILHLSWFHNPLQVREALSAGAAGFLSKSLMVTQLADAIRTCHHTGGPVLEEQIEGEILKLDQKGVVSRTMPPPPPPLSFREFQILQLIALPDVDIAKRLGLKRQTVRNYVHKIMNKVGAKSRREVVLRAREQGLIP